jgi:hypothetical protein
MYLEGVIAIAQYWHFSDSLAIYGTLTRFQGMLSLAMMYLVERVHITVKCSLTD